MDLKKIASEKDKAEKAITEALMNLEESTGIKVVGVESGFFIDAHGEPFIISTKIQLAHGHDY